MRIVCFVLLSLSFQSAFAQQPKLLVGFNAAGVWNSYSLAQNKTPYLLEGRINWSGGIQSKILLTKKWSVNAQINATSKNFGSGVDYSYFRAVDPNDPIFSNSQSHYPVRQVFLEVPVEINYLFTPLQKVSFFCSAGFTNSFLLSSSYGGKSYISSGGTEVAEGYKSYLISLKTGGGLLFPIGKKFYGSAECYSNVYLQRVNQFIKANPFQLALGFSVLKKFGSNRISNN